MIPLVLSYKDLQNPLYEPNMFRNYVAIYSRGLMYVYQADTENVSEDSWFLYCGNFLFRSKESFQGDFKRFVAKQVESPKPAQSESVLFQSPLEEMHPPVLTLESFHQLHKGTTTLELAKWCLVYTAEGVAVYLKRKDNGGETTLTLEGTVSYLHLMKNCTSIRERVALSLLGI